MQPSTVNLAQAPIRTFDKSSVGRKYTYYCLSDTCKYYGLRGDILGNYSRTSQFKEAFINSELQFYPSYSAMSSDLVARCKVNSVNDVFSIRKAIMAYLCDRGANCIIRPNADIEANYMFAETIVFNDFIYYLRHKYSVAAPSQSDYRHIRDSGKSSLYMEPVLKNVHCFTESRTFSAIRESELVDHIKSDYGLGSLRKLLGTGELYVAYTEFKIGKYRLDLVLMDQSAGNYVGLEAMTGPADHSHIGQVFLYLHATNFDRIVFVCENLSEEKKTAIRCFNAQSERRKINLITYSADSSGNIILSGV